MLWCRVCREGLEHTGCTPCRFYVAYLRNRKEFRWCYISSLAKRLELRKRKEIFLADGKAYLEKRTGLPLEMVQRCQEKESFNSSPGVLWHDLQDYNYWSSSWQLPLSKHNTLDPKILCRHSMNTIRSILILMTTEVKHLIWIPLKMTYKNGQIQVLPSVFKFLDQISCTKEMAKFFRVMSHAFSLLD